MQAFNNAEVLTYFLRAGETVTSHTLAIKFGNNSTDPNTPLLSTQLQQVVILAYYYFSNQEMR